MGSLQIFRGALFLTASAWLVLGFQAISPSYHHSNVKSYTCVESVSPGQTSAATRTTPDMEAFANGYKTVFNEVSCALCTPTVGELPSDLVGTYYRCGPAMFSAGSLVPPKNSLVKPKQPPALDGMDPTRMVLHPFEGDGAVLAITFHGNDNPIDSNTQSGDFENTAGKVTIRYKFVRTNAFTNERKKGKKLYTGMESTRLTENLIGNDLSMPFYRYHLLPGLNKQRKNTSNTRVVYFANKLLTLWSGGLPYKLDRLALSTEGRSQLGGAIKKEDSALGGKAAIDARRKRILFYGIDEDASSSQLNIYEFDSKFKLITENEEVVQVKLPGLAIIHDFSITENYAVFVQPVVQVNRMQYMFSKEPGKTLSLTQEPSLVHIISRVGSNNAGAIQSFQIPYDDLDEANLHFINAYEDNDNTIVFDVIRSERRNSNNGPNTRWPWATSLSEYKSRTTKKSLWRYKVHPQNGFISKDLLSNEQIYFGTINSDMSGECHRYVYAAVGALGSDIAPPQGIIKYDLERNLHESWFPESYEFCGEPMYAPRQQGQLEDGGYVLSVLYNGRDETSELIILEADSISQGPITRIPLEIAIPHGFHGCFASGDDANWLYEEIKKRAKLADKIESRGSMWNEVKSDFSGLGLRFDDMEEYFGDLM